LNFLNEAEIIKEKIIAHRRRIHNIAEVGRELPETFNYICNELENMGISYEKIGGGISAEIGKDGGVTVLLRADADALPMCELSGESFAAENGNMHSCGHDMHSSMLLGAAEILKKQENSLQGKIKLIFQPAEELLEGARAMVDAGVIADERPDAAVMIHVICSEEIPVGTVVLPSGGAVAPMAAFFEIEVKGKSAHGASPKDAKDAITSAARMLLALQELSARELVGLDAVITVGKFNGGSAKNAIADNAKLGGSIRAYDQKIFEHIKLRIEEICDGIGSAFGTRADISYQGEVPAFRVNEALAYEVKTFSKELLGEEKVITPDGFVGGGSEDFSCFAEKIPSTMIALSAGANEYTLHNPKLRFDESVLPIGAALYAYVATRLIEDDV